MATILLLGSGGTLGKRIKQALQSDKQNVICGVYRDQDLELDQVFVDVTDQGSVRQAIDETQPDAVVIAARQVQPVVQAVSIEKGISSLDVNPSGELAKMVADLDNPDHTTTLMMAGLFPGLSGVLAKAVSEKDGVEQVLVGLLQNTNAQVGSVGVHDMLSRVAKPIESDGVTIPAFSEGVDVDFGNSSKPARLYRFNYDEARLLANRNIEAKYYTGWNSSSFTLLVRWLVKLKAIRLVSSSKWTITPRYNSSKSEVVRLVAQGRDQTGRSVDNSRLFVEAESDYGATSRLVAAMVTEIITRNSLGFVIPADFLRVDDFTDCVRVIRQSS